MSIKTNISTLQSVIAIEQEEGKLKAIELREQHGTTNIRWMKSSEEGTADWKTFAEKCGLSSVEQKRHAPYPKNLSLIIIGFLVTAASYMFIHIDQIVARWCAHDLSLFHRSTWRTGFIKF